eukprot:CAMPEP_0117423554 /NCGR_PEP_ID=MMETSP0758-20121206/4145_1 /TAXON_ID=63605 /ORGANISM="Percolomonas cosmopolitus, Strain AE-1 (ATCC 50343)" /LENGTH=357 /DNA_ID=CAMNT_0005206793 /DNA_START=72 /DNA_END=1142 /DNA_ORIENTATION=-
METEQNLKVEQQQKEEEEENNVETTAQQEEENKEEQQEKETTEKETTEKEEEKETKEEEIKEEETKEEETKEEETKEEEETNDFSLQEVGVTVDNDEEILNGLSGGGTEETDLYEFGGDDDDDEEDANAYAAPWMSTNHTMDGYSQGDQDDVTLEQLFAREQELFKEIQEEVPSTTRILTKKENILKLIHYVVDTHPVDEPIDLEKLSEGDEEKIFKYPFYAYILLSLELQAINMHCCNNDEHREIVFSYLTNFSEKRPSNSAIHNYYVCTLDVLLKGYYIEMTEYVKTNLKEKLIGNMVKYGYMEKMDQLLMRLLGYDVKSEEMKGANELMMMDPYFSKPVESEELLTAKNEMKEW